MARLNLFIAVLLMLSAISLVTSRYHARQLFIEMERGNTMSNALDIDWRRLQLERAELARNARIDRAAREDLKLVPVVPERTFYLNQAPIATVGEAQ